MANETMAARYINIQGHGYPGLLHRKARAATSGFTLSSVEISGLLWIYVVSIWKLLRGSPSSGIAIAISVEDAAAPAA